MLKLIPVVPAKDRRHLHYGMRGNDVKAFGRLAARTLRRLGVTPVNAQNGVYGDGLLKDTLRLQKLEALISDGVVGPDTWQAVDPQMHAWERLLLKLPKPPAASNGVKIAAQMRRMLVLRMPYYSQRRPAATTINAWDTIGSDCSGSGLLARALALGESYDGYGNTGTIWANFVHVSEADVELGDYVLYGSNGVTHHVAVVSDVEHQLAIGFGAAPGREAGWRYRSDLMGFRRGA